jgi:hypothetical protein
MNGLEEPLKKKKDIASQSLTLALEGGGQLHDPTALLPRKEPPPPGGVAPQTVWTL